MFTLIGGNINVVVHCWRRTRACWDKVKNSCKKDFPKKFTEATYQDNNGFYHYTRRSSAQGGDDRNQWVVPYNAYLSMMLKCHVNVERVGTVAAVKYLYKYVYKGHDRSLFEIKEGSDGQLDIPVDEVANFVNSRYLGAPEAVWRLLNFRMRENWPAVISLPVHLQDEQEIRWKDTADAEGQVQEFTPTQLTGWFLANAAFPEGRDLTYPEYVKRFVWQPNKKQWSRRTRYPGTICRLWFVPANEGERFYLRLLLLHIKGATSWDDLRGGHDTFQQHALALGLIEDGNEWDLCFQEAIGQDTPAQLRRLFITMMKFSAVSDPRGLWEKFQRELSEDFSYNRGAANRVDSQDLRMARFELQRLWVQSGRDLERFPLEVLTGPVPVAGTETNPLIQFQLSFYNDPSINLEGLYDETLRLANPEQNCILSDVMASYRALRDDPLANVQRLYYINASAGTGKTFTLKALLAGVRLTGLIAIAVGSSGIACTLIPGAKTPHSTFGIPLELPADGSPALLPIALDSDLGQMLKDPRLQMLVWDELPMTHRIWVESVDLTLQYLRESPLPFGGLLVVMGGDFRQTLPVVPKSSRAENLQASFRNSSLYQEFQVMELKTNQRLAGSSDEQTRLFGEFLLEVGDGNFVGDRESAPAGTWDRPMFSDTVLLPDHLHSAGVPDNDLSKLIDEVYPDLHSNLFTPDYFTSRAILAPLNKTVDSLNDKIADSLNIPESNIQTFHAVDQVSETTDPAAWPVEFLSTLRFGGLPPASLRLFVGMPVMLLRNMDQPNGHCNGSRYVVTRLRQRSIRVTSISGSNKGQILDLCRIKLTPSNNAMPFKLSRTQFPISPCFAISINKSQGQSLSHVGVYLPSPCFSHGQLFVALSRAQTPKGLKVLCHRGLTRNVVWKEALL